MTIQQVYSQPNLALPTWQVTSQTWRCWIDQCALNNIHKVLGYYASNFERLITMDKLKKMDSVVEHPDSLSENFAELGDRQIWRNNSRLSCSAKIGGTHSVSQVSASLCKKALTLRKDDAQNQDDTTCEKVLPEAPELSPAERNKYGCSQYPSMPGYSNNNRPIPRMHRWKNKWMKIIHSCPNLAD